MREYTEPPVREARDESEKSWIEQAKRYHLASQQAIMESLDKARRSGEALRKLKKAHRKEFTEWFKSNEKKFGFKYLQATRYMQIAKHWDEVKEAGSISKAISLLRAKKKKTKQIDGEENSETPSVNGRQKKDQNLFASIDWSYARKLRSKSVAEKGAFAHLHVDLFLDILLKKIGLTSKEFWQCIPTKQSE